MPFARCCSRSRGCFHMKKAWLAVGSTLLWILSGLHFFIVAPSLVFLGIFLDTRKHDWLQRTFCRRISFLAGATVGAGRSAGFQSRRTSFFQNNHANLFDPFLFYSALPQVWGGTEAEPHLKISPD